MNNDGTRVAVPRAAAVEESERDVAKGCSCSHVGQVCRVDQVSCGGVGCAGQVQPGWLGEHDSGILSHRCRGPHKSCQLTAFVLRATVRGSVFFVSVETCRASNA